jgi:hypothetical protein
MLPLIHGLRKPITARCGILTQRCRDYEHQLQDASAARLRATGDDRGRAWVGQVAGFEHTIDVAAAPCFDITKRLLNRERARCENGLHCFTSCSF